MSIQMVYKALSFVSLVNKITAARRNKENQAKYEPKPCDRIHTV